MVLLCFSAWDYVRHLKARPAAVATFDLQSTKSLDAVAMRVVTGTSRWTVLFSLYCWLTSAGDKVFSQSTPTLHTLVSVPSWSLLVCVLFREKRLNCHGEQNRASESIILICWYCEVWARVRKHNVNTFFECMSTSKTNRPNQRHLDFVRDNGTN